MCFNRSMVLLLVIIAFIGLSCASRARHQDRSLEVFEDPELIRVERSDYSIGGPLAKSTENGAGGGKGAPAAASVPAASASKVPAPAANEKPAEGVSAFGVSSAPTGFAESGYSSAKPEPRPPSASPPPGSKPAEKGKNCPITVVPGSVLPEIGSNSAQLPDYNLKYTDSCKTIGDCKKLCEKAACNYFIRSTDNDVAHFYTVIAEKIKSPNYVESGTFDSYVPQCPAEEKLPEFGPGAAASQLPSSSGAEGTRSPSAAVEAGGTGGTAKPFVSSGPGGESGGSTLGGAPIPGGEGNTARTRKPFTPIDRCPECTVKDLFKKWLLANNRSYNLYEEERRFKIFEDNLKRIAELVKSRLELADANYTISKFTDRIFGEFLQQSTGAIPEETPADVFQEDVGIVPGVPSRFDWSEEGVVPEPRDQQDCGSCYAFTTADLTATQWAIDHEEKQKTYLLAPQVVLDCIKPKAAFGCNGGRPYLVLSTHANCSACPWPRESCYPYENKANDQCKTAEKPCVESDKPQIHVKHAHYLDVSEKGGEKERLAALLQGGVIAALVQVTDHWQFYSGGIMRASQCKGATSPNHAVLITGYDFTGPVPAYIIKNSWGKDWGEEGYFRLEAGKNSCGIAKFLSFACTEDCGDNKSVRQLIDRAIKLQKKRGFGTTTPQPQAYGVKETFPYAVGTTVTPYGQFTVGPVAPPPPRPPTGGPPPPTQQAQAVQTSAPATQAPVAPTSSALFPSPPSSGPATPSPPPLSLPAISSTSVVGGSPQPVPPAISSTPSYFSNIQSPAPTSGNAAVIAPVPQPYQLQPAVTSGYQSAPSVPVQSQPGSPASQTAAVASAAQAPPIVLPQLSGTPATARSAPAAAPSIQPQPPAATPPVPGPAQSQAVQAQLAPAPSAPSSAAAAPAIRPQPPSSAPNSAIAAHGQPSSAILPPQSSAASPPTPAPAFPQVQPQPQSQPVPAPPLHVSAKSAPASPPLASSQTSVPAPNLSQSNPQTGTPTASKINPQSTTQEAAYRQQPSANPDAGSLRPAASTPPALQRPEPAQPAPSSLVSQPVQSTPPPPPNESNRQSSPPPPGSLPIVQPSSVQPQPPAIVPPAPSPTSAYANFIPTGASPVPPQPPLASRTPAAVAPQPVGVLPKAPTGVTARYEAGLLRRRTFKVL